MNKFIIISISLLLSACASESYTSNVSTESHQEEFTTDKIVKPLTVSEDLNKTKQVETVDVNKAPQISLVAPSSQQLLSNPRYGFTIQLMATANTNNRSEFIQSLPNTSVPVWQNKKVVNGKNIVAILYGDYKDTETATRALNSLPMSLQNLRPFVKSIDKIKNSDYPVLSKLR